MGDPPYVVFRQPDPDLARRQRRPDVNRVTLRLWNL
jgi:hypothetical protein